MSDADVFDQILVGFDIEEAVTAHLKTWMATYIGFMERKWGITPGKMPQPRTWTVEDEFVSFPEERLPIITVISAGVPQEPHKSGTDGYRAGFAVGIAAIASGPNRKTSRRNAHLYGGAVLGAMIQHSGISGLALGTEWKGTTPRLISAERTRTISATQSAFVLDIPNVINSRGGPTQPLDQPNVEPPSWPTAESVLADIKRGDIK